MQECTEDVRETRDASEARPAFDVSDPGGVVLAEFSDQERERLARLRRAVERGERGEYFPINKRQDFARWLVSHGKLSEN